MSEKTRFQKPKISKNQRAAVKLFMQLWVDHILKGKRCPNPMSTVASAIGVNRSTLWRWRKDEEYIRYFQTCFRLASFRVLRSVDARIAREQKEREAEERRMMAKYMQR